MVFMCGVFLKKGPRGLRLQCSRTTTVTFDIIMFPYPTRSPKSDIWKEGLFFFSMHFRTAGIQ